jgi:glycosyltransferase involved in cell wall biosynthesis
MGKTYILVSSQHKNWIIDFLAQDIALHHGFTVIYVPTRKSHIRSLLWKKLPKSDRVILMHQSLYTFLVGKKINLRTSIIDVFYTHDQEEEIIESKNYKIRKIFCMSRNQANQLSELFVSTQIDVAIGGPNESQFQWTDIQRDKKVILVSDFKPRKNPTLIKSVIEECTDWTFILHGRGWQEFIISNGLNKRANFQYFEFNFENSHNLYLKAPIFMSLSSLEGGPLPVIEALMSGCSVVATNTGFAQDLAEIFPNVYVIPTTSTVLQIIETLERARTAPRAEANSLKVISQSNFLGKFHD